MKLSEARLNCTLTQPCSIQIQKAEEGEVAKARLLHGSNVSQNATASPCKINLRLDPLNGSAMRPQAATNGTTQTCRKILGTEHTYSPDLASYFFSCRSSQSYSNQNSKASNQLPPRNGWHLVLVVLFGALRIIPWQSKEFLKILKVQQSSPNDSGSNSISLWSQKVLLWSRRILKASWKEQRCKGAQVIDQSLTLKLKHKGPFEHIGQIHRRLVKCWSYINIH